MAHVQREAAAATAIATPRSPAVQSQPFLDRLLSQSGSLGTPADSMNNSTGHAAATPRAGAAKTLAALGAGVPTSPDDGLSSTPTSAEVPAGSVQALSGEDAQQVVALLARLVQVLSHDSHRCKAALQEASATALLLRAMRRLSQPLPAASDTARACLNATRWPSAQREASPEPEADTQVGAKAAESKATPEGHGGRAKRPTARARGLSSLGLPASGEPRLSKALLMGAAFVAAAQCINRVSPATTFDSLKRAHGAICLVLSPRSFL
jgi:hypothetical protein